MSEEPDEFIYIRVEDDGRASNACPCGDPILADTEEWDCPLCHGCLERTATLACMKLKRENGEKFKAKDCKCRPCQSRIIVWGENINVVEQESRRSELNG